MTQRHRLSRTERRRLQEDTGELAETIATDIYSGYNRFVDAPWYDGRRESGAVLEVKSALSTLGSGADGRFRLWREQHEKLVEHDRDGSARYAFVLFDISGREPTALLKQREPATVGRQIGARGGWGPSGHDSQGEQYKLPIEAVFEEWSP
jgi:hypothetical protein